MALLNSEVLRLKAELGYNVLGVGAEPYVGILAIFNQVVQAYLTAGATTTSATSVTASTAPALVTLTLASATGFSVGDMVVLDVDSRQETAMIQSLTGSTIAVLLTKDHGGAYPVTVDGGETIVRENLHRIRLVKEAMVAAMTTAGLKRAEDIEWYQAQKGGSSLFGELQTQLNYWRNELAAAVGLENMHNPMARGGGQCSVPC